MILHRASVAAAARSSAGRRGALYHGQDWPASMLGEHARGLAPDQGRDIAAAAFR